MNSKNIGIDFFVMQTTSSRDNFPAIFNRILNCPLPRRHLEIKGYPLIVTALSFNSGEKCFEGDITKIRLNDLPPRSKTDGTEALLNFDSDEGLGEKSAFLFYPASQLLVFQRNRHAVSPSLFCDYIRLAGGSAGTLSVDPIMKSEAMVKLLRIKPKKFMIALKGDLANLVFSDEETSIRDALHAKDMFGAPAISLGFSVGHLKTELKKPIIEKFIRWARKQKHTGVEISKLELCGESPDNAHDLLNFIEEIVRDEQTVQFSARTLGFDMRRDALYSSARYKQEAIKRSLNIESL